MLKTSQQLQHEEDAHLAPYAMKNSQSIGRVHHEQHDDYRLPFQRDRDRIIHCRAFRRLQAKTQVFVSYYGDHYRDRMTHSIEVAQVARDISRRLGLNEDLSECIALAHDLGHPPFGHGGEDALNECMQPYGLHFEHNEQSRRILEALERNYPGFNGLNLTKEVLDGLIKHHPERYQTYTKFIISSHLESQVADHSDEIAYMSHDLDDGLRAEIITFKQISDFQLWKEAEKHVREEYSDESFQQEPDSQRRFLSRVISRLISHMIHDLQEATEKKLEQNNINSIEKVRQHPEQLVTYSPGMKQNIQEIRDFLRENFYFNPKVHDQIAKGQNIIKRLFAYYHDNTSKLPPLYQSLIESGEAPEIVVKDYIAGMTDHYAEEQFKAANL